MKGLKIALWIPAIVYLLNFLGGILPWTMLSNIGSYIGVDISGCHGVVKYIVRLALVGFGFVGVFYLLLALNPLQYGKMLTLAGYGLILFGPVALAWGLYYDFQLWIWVVDVLFSFIFGGLILFFQSKTGHAEEAPAEPGTTPEPEKSSTSE